MRRSWLLVLVLLLGATVNLAVAWVPWIVRDARTWPRTWDSDQEATSGEDAELWKQHVLATYGWPAPHLCDIWRKWHSEETRLAIKSGRAMGRYQVVRIRAGFPTRAMTLTTWHMSSRFLQDVPSIGNDGIELRSRVLPARIWWPGFVVNTAFYAVALWMAFVAPFALRGARSRWRIRRGLCPWCAYDLRGSATRVCPECGTAVATRGVVG